MLIRPDGHQAAWKSTGIKEYMHACYQCFSSQSSGVSASWFVLFPLAQWMSEGQTEASVYQQAENGKTELSLMHFTIKNPRWQPPQESSVFISHLKEKVHQDAQTGPSPQLLLSEAPLCTSLLSNESATGVSHALS